MFRNCARFKECRTRLNGTFLYYANLVNITMPMNNFIEYSDNHSDTSGSLWGFRRDKIDNNADLTNDDNAPSFKYKV